MPGTESPSIGELPPVGEVPKRMWAQVIRQDRFGDPRTAFRVEEVDVPPLAPDQVLVAVMAAGINFNNVAARPADRRHPSARRRASPGTSTSGARTHPASSTPSARGGRGGRRRRGRHPPRLVGRRRPVDRRREGPMLAPSARIWGYETNFGSFGQFTVAQAHQCLPKAPQLSWEEAAATLVGTTAYRMLHGWPPNTLGPASRCSCGAVRGLGTQAIQLAAAAGRDRWPSCPTTRGASTARSSAPSATSTAGSSRTGAWRRTGRTPTARNGPALPGLRGQVWEVLGERRNPPSSSSIPGGDDPDEHLRLRGRRHGRGLRRDDRVQRGRRPPLPLGAAEAAAGIARTNDEQARAYNEVVRGVIDPCLGKLYRFEEIPDAHDEMERGVDVFGNRVALVGAPEPAWGGSDGRRVSRPAGDRRRPHARPVHRPGGRAPATKPWSSATGGSPTSSCMPRYGRSGRACSPWASRRARRSP